MKNFRVQPFGIRRWGFPDQACSDGGRLGSHLFFEPPEDKATEGSAAILDIVSEAGAQPDFDPADELIRCEARRLAYEAWMHPPSAHRTIDQR
jgi:hypothetical protein